MTFKSQLDSTRFFYIQEGLVIGVGSAIAKVIFPTFPFLELCSAFVLPLIGLGFGFKSWAEVKGKEAEARNGKPELPVR